MTMSGGTLITGVVILAMVVVLGIAWPKPNQRDEFASILTSMGIFGTFLGITYALLGFTPGDDPESIRSSVPFLLEGMRVAFLTSVVGIGFGLVLRFRSSLAQDDTKQETGRTADDIADLMEKQLVAMQAIEQSLVGQGDTTLLTQLKLLRGESSDNAKLLRADFKTFAEKMAEANSEALIRALEEVIKDFNAKINEQFGDNFKQLNDAVGRMLDWQQEYRTQLEETLGLFKVAVSGIDAVRVSTEEIAARAGDITTAAAKLEEVLNAYSRSQADLEAKMKAFAELSTQAQTAFPVIESNLAALTTGMKESSDAYSKATEAAVKQAGEAVAAQTAAATALQAAYKKMGEDTQASTAAVQAVTEKAVKDMATRVDATFAAATAHQEKAAKDITTAYEQLQKQTGTSTAAVTDATKAAITEMSTQVKATNEQARKDMAATLVQMDADLKALSRRNQEAIERHVAELDKMLGEELTKSLNSLGNQLATLSNQFVKDYQPLTARLREVVEMSKGV